MDLIHGTLEVVLSRKTNGPLTQLFKHEIRKNVYNNNKRTTKIKSLKDEAQSNFSRKS